MAAKLDRTQPKGQSEDRVGSAPASTGRASTVRASKSHGRHPQAPGSSPATIGSRATPPGGASRGDKRNALTPDRKRGGEDQWEFQMYQSRKYGNTLREQGGSNSKAVKKLRDTLKDARAASAIALRRTAIEALVPAAAVGNRGALAAQANALGDEEEVVRRTALRSLMKAAGGKRAESGGAVSVALAEALPQFSKSDNTDVRRAAASALAHLAPQQDKELAKIALSWVEDEDCGVRASATEALGLAGSGPIALDALKQGLHDVDWRVCQAAIHALTKVTVTSRRTATSSDFSDKDFSDSEVVPGTAASGGSSGTQGSRRSGTPLRPIRTSMSSALANTSTPAEALAECCRNNVLRGLPRVEAMKALGEVAESGDKSAVLVAAYHLTDTVAEVRDAAVGTLRQLAAGDRAGTIRAAVSQLTDSDWRARESASQALAAVSTANTAAIACNLAAASLEGEDWRGRHGAASALRRLGELDNGKARDLVFGVLIPRLEHPDWSIRRKAAQALGVVAKGLGDVRCIKLLAGLARDPDEEVRIAVVEALPGAAPAKKCKEAIVMAATFAKDSNPRIRVAALNALEELASEERSRSRLAVHAVSGCVKDEVEEVRLAAERVMRSIAKGRRTAIDDITERMQDPDEGVRQAATEAFKGIGEGNRERALKRAVPLLRHEDAGVREAASLALQGMSNPEEAACIAAAANAVGRYRRRFPKAAGYADWSEEEEEEDEEGAEVPPAPSPTSPTSPAAYEAGPAPGAADLDLDDEERVEEDEEPEPVKEDTDTESELSESDTDNDTEPEESNAGSPRQSTAAESVATTVATTVATPVASTTVATSRKGPAGRA